MTLHPHPGLLYDLLLLHHLFLLLFLHHLHLLPYLLFLAPPDTAGETMTTPKHIV